MKIVQEPQVSIITRAYNVEKYIRECADSVLEQSFKNFEWIVLENGSTDRTGMILYEYAQKDKRIRLFVNKRNYNKIEPSEEGDLRYIDLLNKARGKYITNLDSDDFLHKDFLKMLFEETKGKTVDIVAAGSVQFRNDNFEDVDTVIVPKDFRDQNIAEMGNNIIDFYDAFRPTWGKLILRDFYINNIEYIMNRPSYVSNGGDTFICLRLLQMAQSCICIEKPLYYFRKRKNSTSSSNFYKERYLSYDAIFFEGERLLKIWKRNTKENFYRLCLIHLGSMKDNFSMLVNARNTSLEDKLEFIENMLKDEVYNEYIGQLHDKQRGALEAVINSTLEQLYCSEKQKGNFFLEKGCFIFYKYNFGRRFISKKNIQLQSYNEYDMMLYTVSAATNDNTCAHESEFLNLCVKYITGVECTSLADVRDVILQFTQTRNLEIDRKLQVNVLLEEEKYEEVMDKLLSFDNSMKMDCDLLFAKACCYNIMGDLKNTFTLLAIINELYPNEEIVKENLIYLLNTL